MLYFRLRELVYAPLSRLSLPLTQARMVDSLFPSAMLLSFSHLWLVPFFFFFFYNSIVVGGGGV